MATIGVLGGMGAMATAAFYTILTNAQPIKIEQEYMDAIIYSKTSIPDRTAFILGHSDNDPTNDLVAAAITLEQAGANFIAIACVTAHYFYDAIANAVSIPVINMLEEIARYIEAQGLKNVGLLATDGTIQSRILHNVLEPMGIHIITPSPAQQEMLMQQIYSIKQGKHVTFEDFTKLEEALFAKGAEAIILGCTELSLISHNADKKRIDVLAVLADAALKLGRNL